MAAAALRFLLRRREAASPSLALLQPLLGHATGHSPLLSAAGLPDLRRAQLPPAQVPSLLRQYSSLQGRGLPLLRPRIGSQGLPFLEQKTLHLLSAAASLPDSHRLLPSPYPVKSLVRYYSSKEVGAPLLRERINPKRTRLINLLTIANLFLVVYNGYLIWSFYEMQEQSLSIVKRAETQFSAVELLHAQMNDLTKQFDMIIKESMAILEKANNLVQAAFDEKAFTLFDQEMDSLINAIDVFEKGLDSFEEATVSCDVLPLDVIELVQLFCKQMEEFSKFVRQNMKKLSCSVETLKIMKEHPKCDLADV
ncbi:hypothetical protein EJB05_03068 [Eragrostis curvula]|uniref:Uncharacterized protein n=1 Tax=Eragrostis curvula TaxID=38414 RepID=A0A5J9WU54_9POAL|nr:hypothetical protein EJB05_03068 [Eragrostis curvula]